MRQNIRVDIVYYLCDTDFEMEFNLNGCCPMRMLTGQADNRGALVKNLAKAVQRSKVIMCCGPLFGGDGLIGLVSASIGRDTERVNCEEYGIVTASDISVIEGSVPLVTPDGYFGGCIIESGPQTIILLSENRNIRKALMNNLIHPYLEEISVIPDLSQRMKSMMQESANVQNNIPTPIAPEAPANPEIEAEKAAADAAAIVAAALGETSVAAEVAADASEEIVDISSDSAKEETQNEEISEEITPADVELEVNEEIESEQLALDLEEENCKKEATEVVGDDDIASAVAQENETEIVEETVIEEVSDKEETEESVEEAGEVSIGIDMDSEDEKSENAEIIGMVPPEDDNLFAIEEIVEENEEQQPVKEGVVNTNDLFVAEIQPETEAAPIEEQLVNESFPEVELYIEPGAVSRKKMDAYAREYVPSKSDEMFLLEDDDDYEYEYEYDKGKKKTSLNLSIAVLVGLLVLILLVLGYVLVFVPYSQGLDFEQYMDQLFGSALISPFLK